MEVQRKSRYDITGQKFGKLIVLNLHSYAKGNKTVWLCQCDCGSSRVVRNDSLKKGSTTSCGCSSFLRGSDSRGWKGYQEIYGGYWNRLQWDAKKRNLSFNLSIEEAWQLFLAQEGRCALTGEVIVLGHNSKRTASLDRIDSSLGYVLTNVQWVTKEVNFAKQTLSQEDFISLCQKVSSYAKVA